MPGLAPLRKWSLPASATKTQIERALLAVDLFPRAAVLLSIVEGISIADAATVLDADVTLVRKAQAIGVREFTPTSRGMRSRRALAFPKAAVGSIRPLRTARPMRLRPGGRL